MTAKENPFTAIAATPLADAGLSATQSTTANRITASAPPGLSEEFQRVRANSIALCAPLELEDYGLQAMASTSPPKWHLAHTTWFFETFVLVPYTHNYQRWHPAFGQLFNSYYNGIGTPFSRPQRGLLSRPSVREIMEYRRAIDDRMLALLDSADMHCKGMLNTIELGLHHEQQHQELLLTDIKYSFNVNPLKPAYRSSTRPAEQAQADRKNTWVAFDGGVVEVGADGSGFCFDNETPRHRQYLEPFCLAWSPVSNSDVLTFMADGGYQRPELWLADGWDLVQREHLTAPLYWQRNTNGWCHFTLAGVVPLAASQTACHLSYYEADAYARWAGARLPTEAEWEHAARDQAVAGNFVDTAQFHPGVASAATDTGVDKASSALAQLFGDVWEWTSSSYSPYPGFTPPAGAIGEYNGKFMSNQMVLRGGSCVSDRAHIRATYRNFFYPADRWQFSGVRLARSR